MMNEETTINQMEAIVVGSVIINPTLLNEVVARVGLDAFSAPYKEILMALEQIKNSRKSIKNVPVVLISGVLSSMGKDVDKAVIRNIVRSVITTDEFEPALSAVSEYRILNNVRGKIGDLMALAERGSGVDVFYNEFESVGVKLNQYMNKFRKQKTLKDYLSALRKKIDHAKLSPNALTGIPSGSRNLDYYTAGFQNGDMTILAGRPSMGKTALALTIARNNLLYYENPIAFFSYEMSGESLLMRLITSEARVSAMEIKRGNINDSQHQSLINATNKYENYDGKLYVDDEKHPIDALVANIEIMVRNHGVKLVMVDYIQLVPVGGRRPTIRTREEEVAYISKTLKAVAGRTDTPIIAVSQLSRATTRRETRRPELSDLRESGALEQDADLVLFVHRPIMYGVKEQNGRDMTNVAEIIIAKQRNGPVGTIEMFFDPDRSTFENLAVNR